MVDTKQARWVFHVAQNFCGCLILQIGHFFLFRRNQFLRLGVMKQECSVIVRWREFTPFNFVIILIVSLVCQNLLIAGLNIQSIQLN